MIRVLRGATAFVFALALCSAVSAATYYVSPSGNDRNRGVAEQQPFRTVQHGRAWAAGSDWMPYGLGVPSSMAQAEALAKKYKSVSIVPEINVEDLPWGILYSSTPSRR